MKKNTGFTLIELLIVVAIIGILSAIIVSSVSEARKKGADSAVKHALSGVPAQSELYYHANGFSYANACVSGTVGGVKSINYIIVGAASQVGLASITVNGTGTLTTATCNNSATAWAAEVPMKNKNVGGTGVSNMFCADSTGFVGYKSTTFGAGVAC
jgi:prepilin-type N-terminal cleavage/methylation domain-containing protein